MSDFDEVKKIWLEFRQLPFPPKVAGEEVEGIDVTSLDSFTAGCIDTFISQKGRLDNQKKVVLEKCRKNLKIIVAKFEGDTKAYFEKLLQLAEKIL